MKVLILSASTGGGHMSAAKALKSLIEKKDSTSEVKIVDCLEYVSHQLNITVSNGYKHMATKTPNLFGALYKSTNKENTLNSLATSIFKKFGKRLLPLMEEFKPDVVVCTHAFAGDMMAELKTSTEYNINVPLISVITDYAPHRMYVNKETDTYVVSNDDMILALKEMGVEAERIKSIGIPIDTSFYSEVNREKELTLMGLSPDKPTLLIMAGSFGVTDILKIYAKITEIKADFQVIVITGKNKKLYNAFEILLSREDTSSKTDLKQFVQEMPFLAALAGKKLSRKETKLLYFTDEVQKYMHCSDLIITKPGGLTVSESLASSLPMAIFKAIPGQEEENSEFLIKNGAAVKLTKSNCAEVVEDLLKHPSKLEAMKKACKKVCKESSAEHLYKYIYEITVAK